MSKIPTITYVLDGIGIFGALVGGAVAARSKYATENSKDAAALIDTQRKRIDSLLGELKTLKTDRDSILAQMNDIQGQLKAYKELQLIQPDTVEKFIDTQQSILKAIQQQTKVLEKK